jgi:hypothetical protein
MLVKVTDLLTTLSRAMRSLSTTGAPYKRFAIIRGHSQVKLPSATDESFANLDVITLVRLELVRLEDGEWYIKFKQND